MSSAYDQNTVKERIREATDIVELVERYVPLRRQGRNYVGRCPWHDDSRPSLHVNPERQIFKCYVCGIGGDVFAFIMKIENVDFREALQILADKAGISLPKSNFQKNELTENTAEITRKQLLTAADWLAKNYHKELLQSEEAEGVRQYLEDRKITAKSIRQFNIGYAPISKNWLINKAQHRPERIKILELVGNFKFQRNDFFRGRLIFPIRDEQGRTVAFGGRLVPGSPLSEDDYHKNRKYLNSSETPLFSKHKVLYGLDAAKHHIKETRRALIMEGYTDCVVAHQFGFGEAVAILGTALGPAHIRLLNRVGAEKIILMLDGDKAGKITSESNEVLTDFIAHGADMAVLMLPEGLDPCEFLEQHGADALHSLLESETVDALDHIFRVKTKNIELKNDIIASSNALDSILEIVGHAPVKGTSPNDPIRFRLEKTIQNLSVRFTMPEEEIRRRLKEKQQRIAQRPIRHDTINQNTTNQDTTGQDDSGKQGEILPRWNKSDFPDLLERDMLELWMMDPTAIYAFWEHVLPEHLRSPITRLIYEQCVNLVDHQGKPATFDNLMTAFDDLQIKNYLVELATSAEQKFFPDEVEHANSISPGAAPKVSPRRSREIWKDPVFQEKKLKLVDEIIGTFEKRERERRERSDLNQLRDPTLSDEEKTKQLLELQQKLREKNNKK